MSGYELETSLSHQNSLLQQANINLPRLEYNPFKGLGSDTKEWRIYLRPSDREA
jgi:hypothetical protein